MSISSWSLLIALVCMAWLNICCAQSSKPPGSPLIVGGRIARKRYRKHLAYIFIETKSGDIFTCTGTTIGRRWLLTAAHCVDSIGSSNDVDVRSSYAHISIRSLNGNLGSKYFFRSVHVHKNYNPGTSDFRHDIAVVQLQRNIIKKRYRRVRLGGAPHPGTEVIGAGYGALNENGRDPDYAMQTIVVAQSFRTCASREPNSIKQYLRNGLQVCATSIGFPFEGETDTCCKLMFTFKSQFHLFIAFRNSNNCDICTFHRWRQRRPTFQAREG